MNWEKLTGERFQTWRAVVPGGWLYLVSTSARETMVFVPTPVEIGPYSWKNV